MSTTPGETESGVQRQHIYAKEVLSNFGRFDDDLV